MAGKILDNGSLLTLGLVGVVAAVGIAKNGTGSMMRVRGTGLHGDPMYTRALLVIEVDPDLDREDREDLWDVVSTGSLPILTTSESVDMDSDSWMIVATTKGTDRKIRSELETLVGVVQNMPGVVSIRHI